MLGPDLRSGGVHSNAQDPAGRHELCARPQVGESCLRLAVLEYLDPDDDLQRSRLQCRDGSSNETTPRRSTSELTEAFGGDVEADEIQAG